MPPSSVPAVIVCHHCRKPMRGYFRVERFNDRGQSTVAASVCSVACLLQWTYGYATTAGLMVAGRAREVWQNILGMFRGA